MKPKLTALLILVFVCADGDSQTLVRYQFTQLTPDQGLSSTYVRKIVQDPYGFIWAGTQDGLNRLDGKRIKIYNKNTLKNYSLAGTDIRDLLLDSVRSTIWVLTSYGGINGINYRTGEVWFSYEQQKYRHWQSTLFNSLLLAGPEILIGSSEGLLRLQVATQMLQKDTVSSLMAMDKPVSIDRLLAASGQKCWIITKNDGIFYFDLQSRKLLCRTFVHSPASGPLSTYDATALNETEIILATNYGVKRVCLSGDSLHADPRPYSFLPGSFHRETFAVHLEESGNILLSNAQQLLRVDTASNSYTILAENSSAEAENWLNSVFTIFSDRQQLLWLGCQQGLAYCNKNPSPFFRIYQSATSTTRIEHSYYLFPANDSILFACAQNGLYRVSIPGGKITAIKEGLPFYHALENPFKEIMVSSREGTFILNGNQLTPLERRYPEFAGLGQIVLNSHIQLNDSIWLLGTHNFKGVIVWNTKKRRTRLVSDTTGLRLQERAVNGLFHDRSGRIWVLGDHSIAILDSDLTRATYLVPQNPSDGKYYSIFFDVAQVGSQFYVASYGNGVIVLDSSRRFLREIAGPGELSANSVYKLLPYRDSLLFVTTNNGITMLSVKNNGPPQFFDKRDGLHSNTFEENSGSISHGKIYAGGEQGITMIMPELLQKNTSGPILYLDELRIENSEEGRSITDLTRQTFRIPSDIIQTTLFFSALQYDQAAKLRFAYKIEEVNDQWIDIGTRNVIPLIGLRPGKYNILVKAANDNGIETSPLRLELTLLPKWYQSLLFKIIIILLSGSLFYALYRYRVFQIRKQESIRKNIASDLHDDIGSALNSIKIFSHLAKKNPENEDYLLQIEESVQNTSMSLRDMIWVLDDSADTVQEFTDRVKKFAIPLCIASDITFQCELKAERKYTTLSKAEKRNLLLMTKEAITNALKYAGCSSINIRVAFESQYKEVIIQDNGKGFDTNQASAGNGLRNLQYRACQLSYSLNINSSEKGTTVSIRKEL